MNALDLQPGTIVAGMDGDGLGSAELRALLDSPLPFIVVGPDGHVREVNAAAAVLAPRAAIGQALLLDDVDPVLTHPLRVAGGGTLLLLSSLDSFVQAEQARFNKTPYGLVQLDRQGRIRFANARARALWSERTSFEGELFAGFLPKAAAGLVSDLLDQVLTTETSRTLRVNDGFEVTTGGRALKSQPQLTFVPYYKPGRHVTGIVVHIRERIVEALRIALREAAAGDGAGGTIEDWSGRMRAILDLLQEVVPHDRAVLSVMSRDRRWARPILVHPPADPPMPPGWGPVPDIELKRMQQGPFTVDTLDLLKREPDLAKNSLVAFHLDAGLVANAVLPFPDKHPEAVLTLCSEQRGYFKDDDDAAEWSDDTWPQPPFRSLLSLGLDPLLMGMLRRVERQQAAAMRMVAHRMLCAQTLPAATQALLAALVEQFRWDHAAVFAVEPGEDGGQFRLFAQFPECEADGRPHLLALPPGYTQPVYAPPVGAPLDLALARSSGMLGSAVRAGRPLVAADTQKRDAQGDCDHFFQSPAATHGSAMTVPIELDGRIRWVLDTVSRHQNAFHEDDGELAGPLVRRLARQLANRRNVWLNEMLIERVEQGVVVTDALGTMLRANARARDMLGLLQGTGMPEGRRLSEHASDEATRDFLAGTALSGAVRLGPVGGLGSAVKVLRYQDTTETRDLIWLLDGADQQDWTYDRTYIEATVQEIARQVRGPLLMASTLAGRIARHATEGVSPAIERVRAEIGKADITFERLAEAIGARRDPRRTDDRVDIRALLDEIQHALPERDRARLPAGEVPAGFVVRGDRERLRFVLRTLLGHLLACNPERIGVRVERISDGATARLQVALSTSDPAPAEAAGPSTPLEQAAQAAREAAALAIGTVGDVLRAHGGTVQRHQGGFVIDLPLGDGEEPS